MYIVPTLSFGNSSNIGYVVAQDGIVYFTNNLHLAHYSYKHDSNIRTRNVYIDTQDNNRKLFLYENGTYKITETNKNYNNSLPSGVTGFKSMSINTKVIVAIGNDNNLYVNNNAETNNWKKSGNCGNVAKILQFWHGINDYYFLDNDGNLFYGQNAWGSKDNANPKWILIGERFADAAQNKQGNIWAIDKFGDMYYCPAKGNDGWYNNTPRSINLTMKKIIAPLPVQIAGGFISVYATENKLGAIAKDGWIYYAFDQSIFTPNVMWYRGELCDINKNVEPKERNSINSFFSSSTISSMLNNKPYISLNSPLSNPGYATTFTNNIYPSSNLTSSIISVLAKKGIDNFHPFKILSLADLILLGKAVHSFRQQYGDNKRAYDVWNLIFKEDDPYLPIGDIIVPVNGENTYNPDLFKNYKVNVNEIWCILVLKDQKYSTIITDQLWKRKIRNTWARGDREYFVDKIGNYLKGSGGKLSTSSWSVASLSSINVNNDYINIGEIAYNMEHNNSVNLGADSVFWKNIEDTPDKGLFTFRKRVFGAVNATYLYNTKDNSESLMLENGKVNGIPTAFKFYASSPFNTFVTANEPTTMSYYDFLPEYLIAAMCGNVDLGISASLKQKITLPSCQFFMNDYIFKNNYANAKKDETKGWCKQPDADCDLNLHAFCALDSLGKRRNNNTANVKLGTSDNDLVLTYPNSIHSICNCFMPVDYYQAKSYNSLLSLYGEASGKDFYNQMQPDRSFSIPECGDKLCNTNESVKTYDYRKNQSNKSCPSIGPICLNNLNINVKDNRLNIPINAVQTNDCKKVEERAPTPSNPTPEPAPTPSNPTPEPAPPVATQAKMSPMIIAIIIVIILALIGGGAFFVLR